MRIRELQSEIHEWSLANFPEQTPEQSFLGVVEEVGELAHALLKQQQSIRGGEDHEAQIRDAVGDIVIFLSEFCSRSGFSLERTVLETWGEVKHRRRASWPGG